MKIAVLGAGAFGTALGGILADNGYDVDFYDPEVERENLGEVVGDSDIIVLCAPSAVAPHLLPHLPKNTPLVIATKGILTDEIFREFRDYMVISGPGFAEDIKAAKETKMTITDNRLRQLFGAEYMDFDQTKDKKGVLMCGALKNIYAIMAGYNGLKRGSAEWEAYIAKVAQEMKNILTFNGAESETVDLACGISDLELTCEYPSRNYEYGDLLRQNSSYKPEKTVEGLSALRRIRRGEIRVPDSALILKGML